MTDRIRELAEQAEVYVNEQVSHSKGWSNESIISFRREKFVQLIVRECVTVMYDNAIERRVPPDIDKTPTQYAIAILEHFGVNNGR